jgi:hypothetical protein
MRAVFRFPHFSVTLLLTTGVRAHARRLHVAPFEPDPDSDGERVGTCAPSSYAAVEASCCFRRERAGTCTPASAAPVGASVCFGGGVCGHMCAVLRGFEGFGLCDCQRLPPTFLDHCPEYAAVAGRHHRPATSALAQSACGNVQIRRESKPSLDPMGRLTQACVGLGVRRQDKDRDERERERGKGVAEGHRDGK